MSVADGSLSPRVTGHLAQGATTAPAHFAHAPHAYWPFTNIETVASISFLLFLLLLLDAPGELVRLVAAGVAGLVSATVVALVWKISIHISDARVACDNAAIQIAADAVL